MGIFSGKFHNVYSIQSFYFFVNASLFLYLNPKLGRSSQTKFVMWRNLKILFGKMSSYIWVKNLLTKGWKKEATRAAFFPYRKLLWCHLFWSSGNKRWSLKIIIMIFSFSSSRGQWPAPTNQKKKSNKNHNFLLHLMFISKDAQFIFFSRVRL